MSETKILETNNTSLKARSLEIASFNWNASTTLCNYNNAVKAFNGEYGTVKIVKEGDVKHRRIYDAEGREISLFDALKKAGSTPTTVAVPVTGNSVCVENFQEKPFYFENTYYYPLSSDTKFYELNRIESWRSLPYEQHGDIDFSTNSLDLPSKYKNKNLDNDSYYYSNPDERQLHVPLFSPKGASSIKWNQIDLIESTPKLNSRLAWSSTNGDYILTETLYNYPLATDGITLKTAASNISTIFSTSFSLTEETTVCASIFIKRNAIENDSLTTDIALGFDKNYNSSIIRDKEETSTTTSGVSIGNRWTRISVVETLSQGTHTFNINWPHGGTTLKIAGLMIEKQSYPSIYDAEFFQKEETLYKTKSLIIGNNSEKGPFSSSSFVIAYQRYRESDECVDCLGTDIKLKTFNGSFIIEQNGTVVESGPGAEKNIWETVVFSYNNSESLEELRIYYPGEKEPRFKYAKDIANGALNPIVLTEGTASLKAYLLLGADWKQINDSDIGVEKTFTSYYKDLFIFKDKNKLSEEFISELVNPLFRLKKMVDQTRPDTEKKVTMMASNLIEGTYLIDKENN